VGCKLMRMLRSIAVALGALMFFGFLALFVVIEVMQSRAKHFSEQDLVKKVLIAIETRPQPTGGTDISDIFSSTLNRSTLLSQLKQTGFKCEQKGRGLSGGLDCEGETYFDIGCTVSLHVEPSFDDADNFLFVKAYKGWNCI
jgi:hypothetical protein